MTTLTPRQANIIRRMKAAKGKDERKAVAATLEVSPAEKVAIIEALGFTPGRDTHTRDCPAGISWGYVCRCVGEATTWSAPYDVLEHRNETYDYLRVKREREILAQEQRERENCGD